jgi:hypothetical protein
VKKAGATDEHPMEWFYSDGVEEVLRKIGYRIKTVGHSVDTDRG